MIVRDIDLAKKMNIYGCNVDEQKVKSVNMGDASFAKREEIIGTMGLGPCVGLIAYSKDISYVAHIDMGNKIGINFDKDNNSIRLQELYQKLIEIYKQKGEVSPLYLATVSSETFVFDKKWWSDRAILLDEQIGDFIKRCMSLGIAVSRMPHMQSTFILVDSENGNFYVKDGGYCVRRNFNDKSQKKYLNSLEETKNISSMSTLNFALHDLTFSEKNNLFGKKGIKGDFTNDK